MAEAVPRSENRSRDLKVQAVPQFGLWKVRGPKLRKYAHRVEKRILRELASTAKCLVELDATLIAQEKLQAGLARSIRHRAKADPEIKLILEAVTALLASSIPGTSAPLHSVVRLRTVMPGVEYTVSAPHQDNALWPAERNALNLWLALCDIPAELAPLQIYEPVPEILEHRQNEYGNLELDATALKDLEGLTVTAEFGDLIVFRPDSIHHSLPNLIQDRVRWSIDWRVMETPTYADDSG